jgi:hypothetical protein
MTTRTVLGAALALAALALAGCGGKKPEQAAPAPTVSIAPAIPATAKFDPCSVLTPDEVTAVTTDAVSKTEVIDHDCHYHTAFEEDGTQLSIYPTGGAEQMKDIREANSLLGGIGGAVSSQGSVGKDVQASITPPAAAAAPAIGDEAVWAPNDVLAVRKGDVFVQVTPPIVHDPAKHHGMLISDADKRVISEKLAAAALAKLVH